MVEKQSSNYIKTLRTDRGGEFTSKAFNLLYEENGIKRELTTPYTPEQNGIAERKNRTVVEMARSMLKAKGLPDHFWAEAVATSVYLLNLSPTRAVLNQTPFEAWHGRRPSVSHLRVFGCIAYALINSQSRQKLDEKSEKCIFVGYCTQSKAYRLYNPLSGKISIRRDVIFDECKSWDWGEKQAQQEIPVSIEVSLDDKEEVVHATDSSTTSTNVSASTTSSRESSSTTAPEESSEGTPPRKYRSLTDIYAPCQFALAVSDPTHFDEAAEQEEWQKAMMEEMNAIEKNETWEMVDLPEGKNAIGLKWVFKTKCAADGSIQKHKARLVAKGYVQQYGVDFEETFSPVARFETVRVVLALAAKMQWPVYQFDVKSAFLNGELSEEVYVAQPEGFIKEGNERKVYKLKKALYGLKQAPRAWYSKIDGYFQKSGYEKSENEPTLYLKRKGKTDFIIVCLYVDDIIYTSSSDFLVNEFKSHMMNEFEMSDMGLLHYFLGLEVHQAEDGVFVSQRKYARDLLTKFGMLNCKPAATPMNMNERLQQESGAEMADARRFRSLVGGLIYLTNSRPDIAFAVGTISRFMQQPSKDHYGAAKRVLRYLAGTMEYGLWYSKETNSKLYGFTDSDWAGSLDNRRSISANVFSLGSAVITWSSRLQATVALSTSEAEYVAATSAACQAIWLRRMLAELQHVQEGPTEIFCDNKATIFMTKNPAFHSRTKHIEIRHHFIRELVAQGKIILKYCGTDEQLADILTKALPKEKFCYLRGLLGVSNFESRGSVEK